MRSALLSILILTAAAVASLGSSLGTQAQSNQPAPSATATPQQKPAAPAATTPAQAAPAAPVKPISASTPATMTVVIDPAHGGSDTGARGPTGAAESDIVLDFARAMRVSMEAKGLRVLFTREGNQAPSFDDRSALVNSMRDVVFISLHVSSTGPIGTVRVYSYLFPSAGPSPSAAAGLPSNGGATPEPAPTPAPSRGGLVEWDKAQRPYLNMSQQLASLVQIQLAQKFNGSPEVPLAAGVRQLRSIAAPAIAIEVSSVAVTDPHQLAVMGQPLADAVARAVADFRSATGGDAPATPGGAH